jgi:ABC-type lipoprotein export system ATPase subunit
LADIEWLAQGDTPTKRKILVNGAVPPAAWRFSTAQKLVAQLSQNMNFVMDITTADFITMHCESRLIRNTQEKKEQILEAANRLAGEPILQDMQVTGLSGGQSRALMIADTAYLSASPIVLIDEIENAGINRKQAIELLVRTEKIVVIATHDPVLALSADRRIAIRNGGIAKVLQTSAAEKMRLIEIDRMNEQLMSYREKLRAGEVLD